jgi:hypothetical protein
MEDFRRDLAGMSDVALAWAYEFYPTACGLRTDGVPRAATMQRFWEVWEECHCRWEWSETY